MTWNYTPVVSTTDEVRLLVGDTESLDPLMQDEEIAYIISSESSVLYAAARCCEVIAALFGRRVTTTVGSLRIMAEKKYEHYLELGQTLRRRAAIGNCTPLMPAQSISEKITQEDDTDRLPPFFSRSTAKNPLAAPSNPRTDRSPYTSWP